jgi:hypothetical protein
MTVVQKFYDAIIPRAIGSHDAPVAISNDRP